MADFEEKCIGVKFCFKHQRTASEILKRILVTITRTEHRLLIAFLQIWRKLGRRLLCAQVKNVDDSF
jgi:hypothetical protein